MNKQLALGFVDTPEYHDDDFIITNANLDTYRAINKPEIWPNSRLLVIADKGAGKTHLANIFANLCGAYFVSVESDITDLQYPALVLEDIDKIANEEFIFHLINHAQFNKIPLLLTAAEYKQFALPDLRSRINATMKMLVKAPDDSLLRIVLTKHLLDKQLVISAELLNYIIAHAERSFGFITEFCNSLNRLCLESKGKPTLPLIKKALYETALQ